MELAGIDDQHGEALVTYEYLCISVILKHAFRGSVILFQLNYNCDLDVHPGVG